MTTIVQQFLIDLRNERDSWMQAGRDIEVLQQTAQDAGQIKVVQALHHALTHADKQRALADQRLTSAEEIVAALRKS